MVARNGGGEVGRGSGGRPDAGPPPGAGGEPRRPGRAPPTPVLPAQPLRPRLSSPHDNTRPHRRRRATAAARDLPPGPGRRTPHPEPRAARGSPPKGGTRAAAATAAAAGARPEPALSSLSLFAGGGAALPSPFSQPGPPAPHHPTRDHAGTAGGGGRCGRGGRGGRTSPGLRLGGRRAPAGPARRPPAAHPEEPGGTPGGD